jgi:hypothetical protein
MQVKAPMRETFYRLWPHNQGPAVLGADTSCPPAQARVVPSGLGRYGLAPAAPPLISQAGDETNADR